MEHDTVKKTVKNNHNFIGIKAKSYCQVNKKNPKKGRESIIEISHIMKKSKKRNYVNNKNKNMSDKYRSKKRIYGKLLL